MYLFLKVFQHTNIAHTAAEALIEIVV